MIYYETGIRTNIPPELRKFLSDCRTVMPIVNALRTLIAIPGLSYATFTVLLRLNCRIYHHHNLVLKSYRWVDFSMADLGVR
jgi:hypothetical protein